MTSVVDFGRSMGLLYDEESRDGAPGRVRPTRAGWAMGAIGLLMLLVGLATVGLLGATLANTDKLVSKPTRDTCEIERSLDGSLDDRCAPCEQQNEQQKLSEFVKFQLSEAINVYGAYPLSSGYTMSLIDEPNNQDPLFPDIFQDTWDTVHEAAQDIDMSLLDPYDAISFDYMYQRKHFFGWRMNETAQIAICENRSFDWIVPSTPLTPAQLMFGYEDETVPNVPTARGAWVLNKHLFDFYVGQLEQSISSVRRRTTGDWWTAVHSRIVAGGGVLRTAFVTGHLNAIITELSLTDPLAMPQPVVSYILSRGYEMTPDELAYLYDVLGRYYAAQDEFFSYSLSVTPSLSNGIAFNAWALTYGWTACFGYANGLWFYDTNYTELMDMFLFNKARIEALAADMLVERDALWPKDAWLPWQDTYLHYVFPTGLPNPLNISGWGVNPAQCYVDNPTTGLPLFVDTLSRDVARYYNERYKLYNAANGPLAQHLMTLNFGACTPLAGNGYTAPPATPLTNQYVTPPTIIAQSPGFTLNSTIRTVVHEQKHAAQLAMIPLTACPTCYGNFITLAAYGLPITTVSFPANFGELSSNTFIEGTAVDAEMQGCEVGIYTRWECFHTKLYNIQQRNMLMITTTGIRLGYWDLAGAVAWMNTYSWFPSGVSPTLITQVSLREMTATTGFYGLGSWYAILYRERARAACGTAFSDTAYNTLTHSLPPGPISMWRALLDNYVANNCTSPTTRFGDARRTVVAPSLRGM